MLNVSRNLRRQTFQYAGSRRPPRGIGKEFVKGKGAATGGIPAMAGASIQMGAAQVENLSEPKTWYDYVASAALTMASPAAKGALSFVSPQIRSAATNWLQ